MVSRLAAPCAIAIILSTLNPAALNPAALAAGNHSHSGPAAKAQPYAGQQSRTIKSLSPDDIAELRRGGGWGLAKSAELNGVPGPAHLLEVKDDIALGTDQIAAIKEIYEDMRARAVVQGERLIDLEQALEDRFRDGTINEASLRSSLAAISEARMNLRFIHLSAHLKTPDVLSENQVKRYNFLRGYAADPCASAPKGHDVALWRKHNGCQ